MAWVNSEGAVILSEKELEQFRAEGFDTAEKIANEIKQREFAERLRYAATAAAPKHKKHWWHRKNK